MHDDPLGLNRGGAGPEPNGWNLPQVEPTNLIALWPHDERPTRAEIVAALEHHWAGVQIVDELDPPSDEVLWGVALEAEALANPAVVWAEAARPLPPGELKDPRAETCKWALGIESTLDPDDPLTSYQRLVRFLAAPCDELPGMLDVNTTGWIQRRSIREHFLPEDNIPPIEVLWIVHAVSPAFEDPKRGGVWLHTHGLWRCGRPELEMLEVESDYVSAAGGLINDLAERILDGPPPPPGEPFSLGENLTIVLQPWQDVVRFVPAGVPGGESDRAQDDQGMHVGARAVICDEQPRGAYRPTWSWPKQAIERLQNDQAVIWKSSRATQRAATQARYTWGELATAFAKLRPHLHDDPAQSPTVVLVKAGFPHVVPDSADDSAEHMWLQVLRFDGDRVEGRLLNEPMFVTDVQAGQTMWIERDRLSEWRVMSEHGAFGPSDVAAMWRAVDRIAGAPALDTGGAAGDGAGS